MNPDYEKLLEVLAKAVAIRDAAERAAYLDAVCHGDPQLRAQVEALLRAHDRAGDFLEVSVELRQVPPTDNHIGTNVGRYKLLEKLGEGGFGVVYRAAQVEPVRRIVALKIIKPGMDTREVVARFEAERQALALMDHPNIARVLDAGTTENERPYFVMELVEGVPLTEYCDEHRLTTRERLHLFIKVCHAVQHAHQKGIIHRDLKATNVLVTLQDGEPIPKIIDFGVAKALGQKLTEKTLYTAFQQLVGTPAYMSPEQAELSGLDIDTRSDIYSLGVLLYELLTGVTPFDAETLRQAALDEVRRMICEKEPLKPSTRLRTLGARQTEVANCRQTQPQNLARLLHGDLDWVVMKCLEKDRTRRYETANAVALDLQRHLSHEPVTAAAPGALYRARKFVRRHKTGIAAGICLLLLLTSAAVVSTWLAVRATRAERAQILLRREAEADRKEARIEAAKSRQVAQFLEDTLQGVSPAVALGRDVTIMQDILARAATRVATDLTNAPEVELEVRNIIGRVYFDLSDYADAESMYHRALAIAGTLGPKAERDLAKSLQGLATALIAQLKSEGEPLYREALLRESALLRTEQPQIAQCLSNIVVWGTNDEEGKEAEAQRLLAAEAARLDRLPGTARLEVVAIIDRLVLLLTYECRVVEKEPVCRLELALKRRLFGERHLQVAGALGHLAGAMGTLGKTAEAEALYREALAMLRSLLGEVHPQVALTLGYLGRSLEWKGEFAEAEALEREALKIQTKLHGRDHLLTLAAMRDLASVLRAEGQVAEAESLLREEFAVSERTQDRKAMIWSRYGLAGVLHDRGELEQAEDLAREARTAAKAMADADEKVAGSLDCLGGILRDQHRLFEAEAIRREVLGITREMFAGAHPLLVHDFNSLAQVLCDRGKFSDAEKLMRECLALYKGNPPDDWRVFYSQCLLGSSLVGQRRYTEAEPLLRPAYEGLKQRAGRIPVPERSCLKEHLAVLVQLYEATGRPEEAARWKKLSE